MCNRIILFFWYYRTFQWVLTIVLNYLWLYLSAAKCKYFWIILWTAKDKTYFMQNKILERLAATKVVIYCPIILTRATLEILTAITGQWICYTQTDTCNIVQYIIILMKRNHTSCVHFYFHWGIYILLRDLSIVLFLPVLIIVYSDYLIFCRPYTIAQAGVKFWAFSANIWCHTWWQTWILDTWKFRFAKPYGKTDLEFLNNNSFHAWIYAAHKSEREN